MIDPAEFRELVSGRRRGALATAGRTVLRAAEAPYTLAVSWRNRRYDRGSAEIRRAEAPVVSVGNLTLGGTGKTPLVKWLAQWFAKAGGQPAIVSRGYRSGGHSQNDEARELRQSLPDVPHVQNADRVAAARSAIDYHNCDLIILDDGFQHRRLARDLDIVLIDALEPFGFEHVFPRGTLREPLQGLARAQVVCLSRADAVTPDVCAEIRRRVAEIAPQAVWCEMRHSASGLINAERATQSPETLRGRRVVAFCGIGNPAGFRHTLSAAGCEIVAWREFPDHYAYAEDDLRALCQLGDSAAADCFVCTHKDLVKIERSQLGERPLWALAIEIKFAAGREALEGALQTVLRLNKFSGGESSAASSPR